MQVFSMLLTELHDQKDNIISVAKKYGASGLQVFGSVARGQEREDSDVDIIVSLPKGYDMFKQRLALQDELQRIIGKNVDLVVKHEINKYLKSRILEEARDL